MQIDNMAGNTPGGTTAEFQGLHRSAGFENVKNSIADKLHCAARDLAEKAARQDAQSGMGHYGKQASEWLDQSSEYVRQFDFERTNARVRESIRRNPGRSILIAGAVGLVIGAILRRR